MNVYQIVQNSGNFWPPLTAPVLYQTTQGTPCRPSAQHGISLFQGLEEQMAEMKSRRALIVSRPKPAVAFQGRRIAWMLTAEKLLIELLERQ